MAANTWPVTWGEVENTFVESAVNPNPVMAVAVTGLTPMFPVMADVGCRNTVFGAEAQEASLHLDLWRTAGVRHFRLEFAHESAAQVSAAATLGRTASAPVSTRGCD